MANTQIRNFVKHFTNLTPPQQREFERILDDLENTMEVTSLSTSLDLLRKKTNQNLPIPVLEIRSTVRGGVVEWVPLPDQRVTFYEVDTSDTSTFAEVRTVPTFSTSVTIDGLIASKFVRVRGLRNDGTATPYSETGIIAPNLFDIQTHILEDFYIDLIKDETIIIGGPGSALDYTPINPQGYSMVWGGFTMYADPNTALQGGSDIGIICIVKTKKPTGAFINEEEFWRVTASEFFGTYTIGPFAIKHPALNDNIEIRLEATDTSTGNSDPSSQIQWVHLNALELGISE